MARPSKPRWHPRLNRWFAQVGPIGDDGRRERLWAPPEITHAMEAKAWEWMERARAQSAEPVVVGANLLVGDVIQAYVRKARLRVSDDEMSEEHLANRIIHIQKFAKSAVSDGRLIEDQEPRNLAPADVENFLDGLRRKHSYKPNYLAAIGRSIRAVFRWAAAPKSASDGRGRLIPTNPIEGFKIPDVPNAEHRYAETRVAALFVRGWLRHADRFGVKVKSVQSDRHGEPLLARRYDRLTVLLERCMMHTLARPGELCVLRWSDLDWNGGVSSIPRDVPMPGYVAKPPDHVFAKAKIDFARWKAGKKTGRSRTLYFTPALTRALRREFARPDRHPVYVFVHGRGRGGVGGGEPWASGSALSKRALVIRRAIIAERETLLARVAAGPAAGMTAYQRALIETPFDDEGPGRVVNYLFRHTGISSLLMLGVDIATVAELAGTSVEMIRKHYAHLLDRHLAEAAQILATGRGRLRPRAS